MLPFREIEESHQARPPMSMPDLQWLMKISTVNCSKAAEKSMSSRGLSNLNGRFCGSTGML